MRKYFKRLKPLYLLYKKGINFRGTQLVKQRLKKYWKKFENENLDLILIGGGQLIKHNHDFMACMDFWTKRRGIPKIALGVGGDADLNIRERRIYARAVKRCKKIFVRDTMTFQYLKCCKTETELMPDVAFIYSYLFRRKVRLKEDYILIEIYEYSVEKGMSRDMYFQEWAEKIYELLKPNEKLMIAYTTYGDYMEGKRFESYMKRTGRAECCMLETDTLGQLMDAISGARIVYSARMHMLILALNYNKCIEVYPISDKLKIFKEMYGSMTDLNGIQKKVLSVLENSSY